MCWISWCNQSWDRIIIEYFPFLIICNNTVIKPNPTSLDLEVCLCLSNHHLLNIPLRLSSSFPISSLLFLSFLLFSSSLFYFFFFLSCCFLSYFSLWTICPSSIHWFYAFFRSSQTKVVVVALFSHFVYPVLTFLYSRSLSVYPTSASTSHCRHVHRARSFRAGF